MLSTGHVKGYTDNPLVSRLTCVQHQQKTLRCYDIETTSYNILQYKFLIFSFVLEMNQIERISRLVACNLIDPF
jgi:hypothetical protein